MRPVPGERRVAFGLRLWALVASAPASFVFCQNLLCGCVDVLLIRFILEALGLEE